MTEFKHMKESNLKNLIERELRALANDIEQEIEENKELPTKYKKYAKRCIFESMEKRGISEKITEAYTRIISWGL